MASLPLGFLVAIGLFPKEIATLGFNARSAEFSEAVRDLARTNYDSDRREDGYYFGNIGKEKRYRFTGRLSCKDVNPCSCKAS